MDKALYLLRVKKASPVLRQGHPILRAPATAVDPSTITLSTSKCSTAIAAMKSVFDSPYHSIIGLSAPQVGHPLRIIGYKIGKESLNQTKLPPTPLTFLINPTLTPLDRESKWTHEYESCESLPHYNCIVKRPGKVEMKALSLDGAEVQFTVEGFLAKVLHHEMDHLEGVSLVDRMVPGTLRHDQYIDVYENYPAKK